MKPERWRLQSEDFVSESMIRVPGRLSDDGTFIPSEALPKLKPDTEVELRVDASQLTDPDERESWLRNDPQVLFWPGEILRVRVRRKSIPSDLAEHARAEVRTKDPAALYVDIRLVDPLILLTRKAGPGKLDIARCFVPSLARTVKSLNEACKVVSERFEPHRRSHAANVFQEVFYEDEGWWITLGAYRAWVEGGRPLLRRPSAEAHGLAQRQGPSQW